MPEPTTNKNTNTDPGTPRPVLEAPPVKQKTMEASPASSLAQIDVTQELSTQEQALVAKSKSTATTSTAPTIDYKPGLFQEHTAPDEMAVSDTLAKPKAVPASDADSTADKANTNQEAIAVSEPKTYKVQAGDKIKDVAAKFDVSVEELIAANPGKTGKCGDIVFLLKNKILVIPAKGQVSEKVEETIKEDAAVAANEQTATIESKEKSETDTQKEEKAGYISSAVGDIGGKENNLGVDISFVQQQLVRLELMTTEDALAEKIADNEHATASKLPKTIAAIDDFQMNVMNLSMRYGYILPKKGTIKKLVAIKSVEEKEVLVAEICKEKAAKVALAEEQAKLEVEQKAEEIKKAQSAMKEAIRTLQIQMEPATTLNVYKKLIKWGSFSNIANSLVDYAKYNPAFIDKAYKLMGYSATDNLTRRIMPQLSDSQIEGLLVPVKKLFYKSLDDGVTTKEEYALMEKLQPKEGKAENEIKVSKNITEQATNDILKARKTFNYMLSGSVGKRGLNYHIDVQIVAQKFKDNKEEISESALKGKYDSTIELAIKAFQTKHKLHAKGKNPDCRIDPGGGTWKKLFGQTGNYSSGIKDIHASRAAVSGNLGIKDAVGDKTEPTFGKKNVKNNKEDVKYIAKLLKDKKQTVSKENLEGTCDKTMIAAIKSFEKNVRGNKKQYGVVMPSGGNIKDLGGLNAIGQLSYNKNKHVLDEGTKSEAYYKKIDKLQENLGIEEGGAIDEVLTMASKAATDEEYYQAITNDVSAQLVLTSQNLNDRGVALSPVLADRMARYHKFLSAVGLFKGNMTSSEGGAVRSEQTAHIWCGQWIIAGNAAGSKNASTYVAQTQKNLKAMYKEQKSKKGDFITDEDGNKWAKKEHFTEKNGVINMKWTEIQTYVSTINGGRNDYLPPASEGYERDQMKKRKPVPKGPNVTDHKTGEAIDINSKTGFNNRYDSIIDMIGLNFGVVRDGGAGEWWHYELTDLEMSDKEKKLEKNKSYPKVLKSEK